MSNIKGFSSLFFFRDVVDGNTFYVFVNDLRIIKKTESHGCIVFIPVTRVLFALQSENDILLAVPFIRRGNSIFFHPEFDATKYTFAFEDIEYLECINQEKAYILPVEIENMDTEVFGQEQREYISSQLNSSVSEKELVEYQLQTTDLSLRSSEALHEMLDTAVSGEKYRLAAKIRDEIIQRG
jgi:hypothetical protein